MMLFVIVIAILITPFALEWRRIPMDAQARADAPGDFAPLSNGITHYKFYGPVDGPLVVCVHGLTTPAFVYEGLAKRLVKRGYRVLVYDHYGRGYSDRPKGDQNRAFFVSHLEELLAHLNIEAPIDLVGYSMGGWVVTAYAAIHPKMIKRLFLLAPAGMGHELGWTAKLVWGVPIIGDWVFMATYAALHRRGCEVERALDTTVPFVVDRQQKELQYRGFIPSVLASLRGALANDTKEDHQRIAYHDLDVHAIWGADDVVIPLSAKDQLEVWNPKVRHHVIEGAGHGVTYTHTDDMMAAFD